MTGEPAEKVVELRIVAPVLSGEPLLEEPRDHARAFGLRLRRHALSLSGASSGLRAQNIVAM